MPFEQNRYAMAVQIATAIPNSNFESI